MAKAEIKFFVNAENADWRVASISFGWPPDRPVRSYSDWGRLAEAGASALAKAFAVVKFNSIHASSNGHPHLVSLVDSENPRRVDLVKRVRNLLSTFRHDDLRNRLRNAFRKEQVPEEVKKAIREEEPTRDINHALDVFFHQERGALTFDDRFLAADKIEFESDGELLSKDAIGEFLRAQGLIPAPNKTSSSRERLAPTRSGSTAVDPERSHSATPIGQNLAIAFLLGFWHGEFSEYHFRYYAEKLDAGVCETESQAYFNLHREEAWRNLERLMAVAGIDVSREVIEEDRTNTFVTEDKQKQLYVAMLRRHGKRTMATFLLGDKLGGEFLFLENDSRDVPLESFRLIWKIRLDRLCKLGKPLGLPEEDELLNVLHQMSVASGNTGELLDAEQAIRYRLVGRCEQVIANTLGQSEQVGSQNGHRAPAQPIRLSRTGKAAAVKIVSARSQPLSNVKVKELFEKWKRRPGSCKDAEIAATVRFTGCSSPERPCSKVLGIPAGDLVEVSIQSVKELDDKQDYAWISANAHGPAADFLESLHSDAKKDKGVLINCGIRGFGSYTCRRDFPDLATGRMQHVRDEYPALLIQWAEIVREKEDDLGGRIVEALAGSHADSLAERLCTKLREIAANTAPERALASIQTFFEAELEDVEEGITSLSTQMGDNKDGAGLGDAIANIGHASHYGDLKKKRRAIRAALKELGSIKGNDAETVRRLLDDLQGTIRLLMQER